MVAHVLRHFDALTYVEKSKALGVNEEVAKHQARQMEELLDIAVVNALAESEAKELATKLDLVEVKKDLQVEIEQVRGEIHKSKVDMIIWIAGMFIASGLIQHFFK